MSLVDMRRSTVRTMKFPYQVEEFCFSPNSQFLLMTTENGTVEVAPAHDSSSISSSSSSGPTNRSSSGSSSSGSSISSSGHSSKSNSKIVPAAKIVRSVPAHTGNCYCLAVDPQGAQSFSSLFNVATCLSL